MRIFHSYVSLPEGILNSLKPSIFGGTDTFEQPHTLLNGYFYGSKLLARKATAMMREPFPVLIQKSASNITILISPWSPLYGLIFYSIVFYSYIYRYHTTHQWIPRGLHRLRPQEEWHQMHQADASLGGRNRCVFGCETPMKHILKWWVVSLSGIPILGNPSQNNDWFTYFMGFPMISYGLMNLYNI
jgi:hypothetical protein